MDESKNCKAQKAHMMAPNNFVIFSSAEILTFAQELYKRTHVGGRNTEAEMPWDELIWIDSKSPLVSKTGFSGVQSSTIMATKRTNQLAHWK